MMKLKAAIDGYVLSKQAAGLDASTIRSVKRHNYQIADFLGNPDLDNVSKADLSRFYAYLKTEYTPRRLGGKEGPLKSSTLNNYYADISSFWNWAAQELGVKRPDIDLPRPDFWTEQVEPFTKDQIDVLLKKCSFRDPLKRNRAMILTLLDTGLRIGELVRLQVRHAGLASGEITVEQFGTGRKTHGRVVYVSPITRTAIWKYLAARGELKGDDPLFSGRNGRKLSTGAAYQLLQRLGRRAGVADVHPHRFRHTFAIEYLRGGGDVYTLQRLLGHTTMEMVRTYLNLANADSQQTHRRASPVDRWKL